MSNPFENPYASPTAPLSSVTSESSSEPLARRFTRFAAAMVDGILMMIIYMPIAFITGFFARTQAHQVGLVEQLMMSLLGIGVMLALNGYLLATRGQTIGKMLTNIQIVDFENGRLLPFTRVYVYRYLWLLPLNFITPFLPEIGMVLTMGATWIDILMIFGSNRRCLHDLIAGSKVVVFDENRSPVL